jgi:hypothetical protein
MDADNDQKQQDDMDERRSDQDPAYSPPVEPAAWPIDLVRGGAQSHSVGSPRHIVVSISFWSVAFFGPRGGKSTETSGS